MSGERLARGLIGDGARRGFDRDRMAVFDGVDGFRAFEDGKTRVDGIAVEDAREALRDDRIDACRLDGDRGMFS